MLTYTWRGFGSDCESELVRVPREYNMADERRVPGVCEALFAPPTDQTVPVTVDQLDGEFLDCSKTYEPFGIDSSVFVQRGCEYFYLKRI